MPEYVIDNVALALNGVQKSISSSICILGMAYKRDVDDPRESLSFRLLELLAARGAVLTYNDPHIPYLPKMRHYDVPEMTSCELTKEYLAEQDCVLVATDHTAYDFEFITEHSKLIVDTRNATHGVASPKATIVKS